MAGGNKFMNKKTKSNALLSAGKPNDEIVNDSKTNIEVNDEIKTLSNLSKTIEEDNKDGSTIVASREHLEDKSANGNNDITEVKDLVNSPVDANTPDREVATSKNDEITNDINNKRDDKDTNNSGIIIISKDEKPEKNYINFYLKTTTIEKIKKYAGKKKDGKHKTNMNQSELVDYLLNEAFKMMKVK